jgi:hypothetical protein
MQRLLPRYEATLFWIPLGGLILTAWIAGGSIRSYKQIPGWGVLPLLIAGLVLVFGGLVVMYQPTKLGHWFSEKSAGWRDMSQALYATVMGIMLCVWAGRAAFS